MLAKWMMSVVLALCCVLTGQAGPLTEVEITPDPVQNGSQIFTLRMTPGETRTIDTLVFECVYHQEFVPRTSDQSSSKIAHEPEVFTVRRKDVKMIEELDVNISFRVPISLARLTEMYGTTAFNPAIPVTVSRIRVSAVVKGDVIWRYEFDAKGLHKPVEKEGRVP